MICIAILMYNSQKVLFSLYQLRTCTASLDADITEGHIVTPIHMHRDTIRMIVLHNRSECLNPLS